MRPIIGQRMNARFPELASTIPFDCKATTSAETISLSALVPKPRVNLTRFHGVLSRGGLPPNSKLHEYVVPQKPLEEQESPRPKAYSMTHCSFGGSATQTCVNRAAFGIDMKKCERCGGPVRIIASIEDPDVIQQILKHLGLDQVGDSQNRSPPSDLTDQQTTLF